MAGRTPHRAIRGQGQAGMDLLDASDKEQEGFL